MDRQTHDPESWIVAEHPHHEKVIEIWSKDGVLYADVPGEDLLSGDDAATVLGMCMNHDEVQTRRESRCPT